MNLISADESGPVVLVIGKVWPEPASSAAGTRMMQLIRLLLRNGYQITFATTSRAGPFNALTDYPAVQTVEIRLNDPSFDSFVSGLQPSVVIFDRFMTEEQFGWRVAQQCPDAIRVLNTEDLHSLRHVREMAWRSGENFEPEMMFAHEITKREMASVCRSDLSLIISETEMSLLLEHFPAEASQLLYLPFLFDPMSAETVESLPGFGERKGFSTIGNFLHEPNRNSVWFLKKDIWPLIRHRLQTADLTIYGAYPAQMERDLHDPEQGFHIMGRVEDAQRAISATRVLLAPLRFGAGLKGKLFDAMQSGTPSVTTAIGAEGIASAGEWAGSVADQPGDFADMAVTLYQNRTLWESARERGFQILNGRFDGRPFSSRFISRLGEIKADPAAHRKGLFTGSMLMHHTMASTKYLSKWIGEKQKRG